MSSDGLLVEFCAVGRPEPQGSTRAFVHGGRAHITTDNPRLHGWREVVGWAAREAMGGRALVDGGALRVTAEFMLSRPRSAPKRRLWPTTKPDTDKLVRALLDALSGVCWRDDAQVVHIEVTKRYALKGEHSGVAVRVEVMGT